jgi:chromosome segregation protein
MPLRLKSLELHGYKTFASRTRFEFAEGITAIVGPNGSGKSNFTDSLRWALGEQSYLLLRAKRTEDMIFSGSEHRPRAGMAGVTITFDNADGWLPVDFAEVAVTRRAYRDGHNEYLINGQHVRLRDVNELLAQSGLAERTYTILGQGMVDASLALKADERRRLFEEAAGIGLYRSRRDEALKRLENTQRNLERVLDILSELEPRLRSLERQAKRANDYSQVQADLRALLREWYGFHWHRAQQELSEVREVARVQEVKLLETREMYQNLVSGFVNSRSHLQELRAQLGVWHRELSQIHGERETISRDLAVMEERRRSLLESRSGTITEQDRLTDELYAARERYTETLTDAERTTAEFEEARNQESGARAVLQARSTDRITAEERLQAARQKRTELDARKAQLQAHADELKSRIEGQRRKLEEIDRLIAEAEEAARQAERRHQVALSARAAAEEFFRGANNEFQTKREQLQTLEAARRERQDARNLRQADQARLKAHFDVIEQAEQSLTGYAEGARFLLDAARQSRLGGARGALSSALDVPAEYEIAIAASLGDAFDAVLLESGHSADEALSLLESGEGGRVMLLPLDALKSSRAYVASDADVIGVAVDLVRAPDELKPAVDLLLGQTVIVRSRAAARRIVKDQSALRAVTLKGEVFHADGSIQAGRETRSVTLSRPRQKRETSDALESLDAAMILLEGELQKLSGEIESAQSDLESADQNIYKGRQRLDESLAAEQQTGAHFESARRQRDFQVGQRAALQAELHQSDDERQKAAGDLSVTESELEGAQEIIRAAASDLSALSLDELQAQVAYWSTRAAVSERSATDIKNRKAEREQALMRLQQQLEVAQARSLEAERSLAQLDARKEALLTQEHALNERIAALHVQINPAEKDLSEAESKETILQDRETNAQRALASVERLNAQAQIDLGRKEESLDALRRRIEDDFGLVQFEYAAQNDGPVPLPFEGLVEQLPNVPELAPGLDEQLAQKRAQLRRMGPINVEAKNEYDTEKQRYDFMTAQVADLKKAEEDLHQVIAELDELTRREFTKTFDLVAIEFKQIFQRLFGGGSAKLVLTDPDNLTETGIDIEARLPGRREQGLALLSGGERSLTAISLVFALLKVSPTPVCVMDEVDAMLDEANVGRFRDLLAELSNHTQFVIVTHNRNTVQAADVIYGITMSRDSASQIISLKLDEVSDEMLGRRG